VLVFDGVFGRWRLFASESPFQKNSPKFFDGSLSFLSKVSIHLVWTSPFFSLLSPLWTPVTLKTFSPFFPKPPPFPLTKRRLPPFCNTGQCCPSLYPASFAGAFKFSFLRSPSSSELPSGYMSSHRVVRGPFFFFLVFFHLFGAASFSLFVVRPPLCNKGVPRFAKGTFFPPLFGGLCIFPFLRFSFPFQ